MPAAQIASAAIETVLNTLLGLDSGTAAQLKKLSGKQLQITLAELPWPLLFHFSDRIDVVIPLTESTSKPDCSLSLSLSTLQALQDNRQITRLIQQGKLDLSGDIQVAQSFSQLLTQLDIDWEEQLSHYTGDVIAHSVFTLANRFKQSVSQRVRGLTKTMSEGAIEEKRIVAPRILVAEYCNQVNDIRSGTERLEARLALLEKQTKAIAGESN